MSSSCLCSCLHPASVFMSSSCLCSCLHPASVFMSSPCLRVHVFTLPLCSCLHPASFHVFILPPCSCLHPASVHVFILPPCSCLHPASVVMLSSCCPCIFLPVLWSVFMEGQEEPGLFGPDAARREPSTPIRRSPQVARVTQRSPSPPSGVWLEAAAALSRSAVGCSRAGPDVPRCSLPGSGPGSLQREGGDFLCATSSSGPPAQGEEGFSLTWRSPRAPCHCWFSDQADDQTSTVEVRPVQWRSDQYSGGQTSTVEFRPVQWSSDPVQWRSDQYSGVQTSTVEFRPSTVEVRPSTVEVRPVQWRSDPVQWRDDQYSGGQTQYSGGTTSTVEVRPSTVEVRPVQWSSDQYSGVQTQYSGGQTSTVEFRPVQWSSDQYSGVQTQYSGGQTQYSGGTTSTVEVRPRPASFPLEELSPVPQTCGGPGPTHWFVGSSNAAAGAAGVCVYGGGRGWGHHETDPLNHFVVQKC
ncbi:ras-related protein Rab-4B isoform X4 [Gadus morhua]|uniref:ras-related protein Rab-4B isoform X4 n=1 Tax=Gadus morhua TaxID=8049 RepID=UPI0011B50B7E|nr:uncharacterized protein LOC115528950 isoform X4 [Gadus morhua]